MLQLYFFGTPTICFANQSLVVLHRSQICLRLWAFLVMHTQQAHTRDRLATLFWPELGVDRARRTLTNVVWRLRTALGAASDRLVVDKETLQAILAPSDWLDVTAFEQGAQTLLPLLANEWSAAVIAQVESTLSLYRGDFLDEIDDEWSLSWRARLRERYRQTLERFADACQQQKDLARALTLNQRMIKVDPDRQNAYQRAIEIAVALERHGEARACFAAYQRHWTEELGLPLAPAILTLAEQYKLRSSAVSVLPTVQSAQATFLPPLPPLPPTAAANPAYLRRQLEILIKSDELYDLMADRQRQHENLMAAQALADQLGDPAAQLDILARRAWVATHQGEYTFSLSLAQDGLRIAEVSHLPKQRAPFHRQLGIASEELGDFRAALHHYTKALTLDEAENVTLYLPANLNNVATVQLTLGCYWQGIQQLERAQALLYGSAQPAILVKILGNLGYGWMKLGCLQQAQQLLTQADDLAQQIGEHSAAWWVATLQAKLHHLLGESKRADDLALQTYAAVTLSQNAGLLSYLADTLAWLYRDLADANSALVWAQRAFDHATERGHWRYQVRGLMRLGQVQSLLQQNDLALATVIKAVKTYTNKGQQLEEEAELYFTYALCAHVLKRKSLTVAAQQQAETALNRQLSAIPRPEWRQSFLAIQHFFNYHSPVSLSQ